jgi:PAS domain S-box-containing protein
MIQDITERKQAEIALVRSEQHISTIFASITDCCYTLDPEWRFTTINGPALAYFHKTREELLGQVFWEAFPQALGTVIEKNYRSALREQIPVHYETLSPISGRWVEVHAYPSSEGLFAIFHDISARRQLEEKLRESEEKYRTLFVSVREGFTLNQAIYDEHESLVDLLVLDANPAAEQANGLAREEFVGQTWRQLWPGAEAYWWEVCNPVIRERKEVVYENYAAVHDRWYEVRHFSAGKDLLGSLFLDITERKRSEERIQQLNQELAQRNAELEVERERWQGVVEGIADEVWVCDLQGRMSLINLPSMTAMGLQEFEGKTYLQVLEEVNILSIDGQFRPVDEAPLLRSLRGEVVRGEEIMRHRQTGKTRYRQFSAAPMHDASGTITGAVAIVRDITEFKQAEEAAHARAIQIELHHRLLAQREQERQKIARDLHDGPVQELMGIHYALEEMLHRVNDAAVRDGLLAIRDTLQSQVAELRTYAGELRPPTLTKFGLGKAIRSHLDTFQEKHSELRVSFEQNQVGELIPEEMRLGLYRIYQESLTNIVKHAQATQITVRLVKSPTEVVLEIRDNGVGFAVPEDWIELARAGHLGLVGIQERAEAIGGQVEIQSRVGEGTSIQVTVSI